MEVGQNSVHLKRSKLGMVPGGYSLVAFTEATQQQIRQGYDLKALEPRESQLNLGTTSYEAPKDYKGAHHDHFHNFFSAIRENTPVVQNAVFGLRAAGAALLANESYDKRTPVDWNPKTMQMG